MAKQELVLPLPPGNAAMVTNGISSDDTDKKLKNRDELLHSEDTGEKPESSFQYQSEAAQSTTPDDGERVVISGLLMNNFSPEERIVILGNLDNREIAEEEGELEVVEINSFPAEHIDTMEELTPSDYIDTTSPTVWVFYTEAGP
uniref:Uncharacterized protein n=1 Tax=Amphimedon queenslandica TaxID=400682 RepID=A0A1X7SKN2_AMPQE